MPVLYSKFIFSFFRYTKNSMKKSMKITLYSLLAGADPATSKEKKRRKRKSDVEERRRREKSNGCSLSFYIGYFGDSVRR